MSTATIVVRVADAVTDFVFGPGVPGLVGAAGFAVMTDSPQAPTLLRVGALAVAATMPFWIVSSLAGHGDEETEAA